MTFFHRSTGLFIVAFNSFFRILEHSAYDEARGMYLACMSTTTIAWQSGFEIHYSAATHVQYKSLLLGLPIDSLSHGWNGIIMILWHPIILSTWIIKNDVSSKWLVMKTNYMYVIYVRVQVEEFERFGSLKFYVGIFLSIRIPLFCGN